MSVNTAFSPSEWSSAILALRNQLFPEWADTTDLPSKMLDLVGYVASGLSYQAELTTGLLNPVTTSWRPAVIRYCRDWRIPVYDLTSATGQVTLSGTNGTYDYTSITFYSKNIPYVATEPITLSGGTATVDLVQGEIKQFTLVSNGLSNQSFILPSKNISLILTVTDSNSASWSSTDYMSLATSDSYVYQYYPLEEGKVQIMFGDDTNGKIPAEGLNITITYLVGGGTRGNVPADSINTVKGTTLFTVTSSTEFTGGQDQEPLQQIQRRIQSYNRSLSVGTRGSFKLAALRVNGVAQSQEFDYLDGVGVVIMPTGGGAPSTTLLKTVQNYLQSLTATLARIYVVSPVYSAPYISADIYIKPGYNVNEVLTRVDLAMQEFLDPTTSLNGEFIYSFGRNITVGEVYRVLQNVEGVDWAELTQLNSVNTRVVNNITYTIPEVRSYDASRLTWHVPNITNKPAYVSKG